MTGHAVAIPILPVRDMAEAVAFWSRVPHLTVDTYDDGYGFVRHLGHEVIHLGLVPALDAGTNAAGAYLHVPDVDEQHAELVAADLPVTDVRDEPWNMRECRLTDPSGDTVRLGAPVRP